MGRLRCLQPQRPRPRLRHRRTVAPRLPHGRHHQGIGDDRPRRIPAALHGQSGQRLPGHRLRPRRTDRTLGAQRVRRLANPMEQRLGRRRTDPRRFLVHRWREQPVSHREAQPWLRPRRSRHRRARTRLQHARLGRRTPARRRWQCVDREFGRHLGQRRLLRQQRWPHPGLGHHRPRRRWRTHPGVPVLGRGRHRRHACHRRRGNDLRRRRIRTRQRPEP